MGHAARRRVVHFPFRHRWLVVKARSRVTWGQWLEDLIYLLRGH
jgi:hypothetical protein